MNLNRATILGNLTRDPESRKTPSGHSVCNFGIATSSQWKDDAGTKKERVEYHSIVAWGKLADICAQYLHKGSKIYAEGRLQTREWEAQDGSKKQRTEIVLEQMLMLDRKPQGTAPAAEPTAAADTQPGSNTDDAPLAPADMPF